MDGEHVNKLMDAVELTAQDYRDRFSRAAAEKPPVVVSDQEAARLARKHGTLQAAERALGLRIEAPTYPWTTGRLKVIADRVNARFQAGPAYRS